MHDIVFPEGPKAIVGQELSGEYFTKAGPVIERQIARAGYRMAAWLDAIAAAYHAQAQLELIDEL
jgi:S1/P1 Nuclease